MSRQRKKSNGAPITEATRDALLRITVKHLDDGGEANIRLELILAEADCSPSSLYHHFGNLRGLVDEAQIVRFARQLDDRTTVVREAFDRIETRDELIAFSVDLLRGLFDEQGAESRSGRVNALGSTYKRPDFAKRMGLVLQENCDKLAAAFRVAQLRGLIDAQLELHPLAVWVQGLLFGRIFAELIGDDVLAAKCDHLTIRATLFTLFGAEVAARL